MRIQHNIAAINSHRQLGGNNNMVGKNLEKLSSGFRINRAGDDAAGLAISEKMRAQIKGLETAQKNAQDGISLIQTAEGNLTEVHSMLNRMVELATQSANGTYQDTNRNELQKEIDSLTGEIDRIAQSANFNGIKLLDGSLGTGTTGGKISTVAKTDALAAMINAVDVSLSGVPKDTKVVFTSALGAKAGTTATYDSTNKTITVTLTGKTDKASVNTFTQDDIDSALKNLSLPDQLKGVKVTLSNDLVLKAKTATDTSAAEFDTALGALKTAGITASEAKKATHVGAQVQNTEGVNTKVKVSADKAGVNAHTLTVGNAAGTAEGATTGVDGNVALNLNGKTEYSAADINQMLSKSGANMSVSFEGKLLGSTLLASSDAANTAQFTLGATDAGAGLEVGGGLKLQVGETNENFQKVEVAVGKMDASSLGLGALNISSQDGAAEAMTSINSAIDRVSSTRGDLGALQNRLDHTINNLGVTTENMTAAESRVRDVDMAKEMMDFTKNNILTQAAQAMLAQANQLPQGVLQLLQ